MIDSQESELRAWIGGGAEAEGRDERCFLPPRSEAIELAMNRMDGRVGFAHKGQTARRCATKKNLGL